MHLIPTSEEVVDMLRQTGALRVGHFEYPNGMHADEYLQVALAFRYFQIAKMLSVGLSRRLRADTEIRAMIKELSIVCPNTGGLPVAFGVCEALRARADLLGRTRSRVVSNALSPVHRSGRGRESAAR